MHFEGRTAVVTGAARGIGKAIAERLAGEGAALCVIDVDEAAAKATAEEIGALGVNARAWPCDVASFEAVEALGSTVMDAFGSVDVLVNNAGITRDRLIMRMSPQEWDQVIAVNLTGAFNFCKVFGPQMLRQRSGAIVNIASVVGQMGNAGQANYAASKAGLIGLTKSLAKEFAARGVRVNAVAPGFIRTPMTEKLTDEVRTTMMSTIPMGRFGEPEDVADIVYFLASDLSRYVTGQVVNCDGGMIMAR
ncbi:MAG: 3-oxoacyl-[acyl-carrier-protein] reductase [Candidatus Krumholzibacteria bacterium]|nr:3-oxoacyl-[acyl-carrier-protein] reductase [Candidatus Krumholzibacteria bacterium]